MKPSDSSASPVEPMSRSTCRPSASVGASGFSHSTALPACDRRDDLRGVHGVVRGDDDGVHVRGVDQGERVVAGARPDLRGDGLGPAEVDVGDRGDLGTPDPPGERAGVVRAHDAGADHPDLHRSRSRGHRASDERRRSVCAASSATNVSWSQSFSSARQHELRLALRVQRADRRVAVQVRREGVALRGRGDDVVQVLARTRRPPCGRAASGRPPPRPAPCRPCPAPGRTPTRPAAGSPSA